ncbi:MAG: chemotaxis protein CheW [Vampirovibrionales bacterium]|nr:chemotaxis protein CheW [Vampirovibrionales bacterium]
MATKTFTTFKLKDQLFGVEVLYVREINRQLDTTPVPHAPCFVRGLLNLRGQIVTILDLQKRLSEHNAEITEQSCNLILKTENELAPIRTREKRPDLKTTSDHVGLLVDSIDEIICINEDDIAEPPVNVGDVEKKYLSGVTTLEGRLLGILAVDKVLEMQR